MASDLLDFLIRPQVQIHVGISGFIRWPEMRIPAQHCYKRFAGGPQVLRYLFSRLGCHALPSFVR